MINELVKAETKGDITSVLRKLMIKEAVESFNSPVSQESTWVFQSRQNTLAEIIASLESDPTDFIQSINYNNELPE